jgi:phage tail-like protein
VAVVETYIVVALDGDVVRTLPLTFTVLSIGRAPDNGLSLQHPGVSRYHAELRAVADGLIVTDVGSANGTFLDGTRLLAHQPARLATSSTLRIGPFEIALRRAARDQPPAPLAARVVGDDAKPRESTPRVRSAPPIQYEEQPSRFMNGRPSVVPPLSEATQSDYLRYLPTMFIDPDGSDRDDSRDFLGRFLLILESIWEPLERRQDHLSMYFDPKTCPPTFLPWMASWFDLAVGAHWPEGRIRSMLGQVMDLYRWRGTAYGMSQLIEVWTGLPPEIEESQTEPFVFNVRLRLPSGGDVDRTLVEDLLRANKPAHAGFVLEIVR